MSKEKVIERINQCSEDEIDYDFMYEISDDIEESPESIDVFAPFIFTLFEKYPLADFGAPGPLVHLLEDLDDSVYNKLLLESLGRFPTPHTVWMLQRTLEDLDVREKDSFIQTLKKSRNITNQPETINAIDEVLNL